MSILLRFQLNKPAQLVYNLFAPDGAGDKLWREGCLIWDWETLFLAVNGMPPLSSEEIAALEHDYRCADSRLARQRSQIVLLAQRLDTQMEIAKAVLCSQATVARTLKLYRQGGRQALRRRYQPAWHPAKVTLEWQRLLAEAMRLGPEACGVPRPTWTAPLLADYLTKRTGIVVSERTVRRGLDLLGYVCRRPTWTVRHKAQEQPDYAPKRQGSKRS